jgi:hypothetical protein
MPAARIVATIIKLTTVCLIVVLPIWCTNLTKNVFLMLNILLCAPSTSND